LRLFALFIYEYVQELTQTDGDYHEAAVELSIKVSYGWEYDVDVEFWDNGEMKTLCSRSVKTAIS